MMRQLALVVVCLFGTGYCALEQLQPYNLTAAIMFHVEDHNQDGVITRDEIDTTFDKYDANGDGVESRHEYTEYICADNPQLHNLAFYLYDEYDMDHDHRLEKHDYDNFFMMLDTNNDGQVTDDEFIDYWVKIFHKYEGAGPHSQYHLHGPSQCH